MANRRMLPEIWSGTAWNPIREMSRLQRRVDRLFEEMMEPLSMGSLEVPEFSPPCDVQETDTHYLLSFDIPGVSKKDVKIDLRDNQLIVSGERKEETERKEGARKTQERYYGSFMRAFTLPQATEAEKIEANFENGVLQIAVPKSEAAMPKSVQIKEEKGGIFGRLLGQQKEKKVA